MFDKHLLRKSSLKVRLAMAKGDKEQYDQKIINFITDNDDFQKAKIIGLFSPIRGEINVNPLISFCFNNDKIVGLPRMQDDNSLLFYQITSFDDLVIDNDYNILQPNLQCKMLMTSEINICFLPFLAYDGTGARVGYGKGYYDRTLVNFKNPIIGIGYSWQKTIEKITVDKNDVLMHQVITEIGIERF
ncbi:5-formyltetrahydrofolate cyclo-ligase [Spiroplasma endosymbiont of Asaphidion curtum]|uniref:5-formyltetrahydrofolate cyclo-ligase n=1 Tax=Spiroplasma endosymbiont of Asaphidion curtum TaxID=3066281 RepID=UPI00313F1B15